MLVKREYISQHKRHLPVTCDDDVFLRGHFRVRHGCEDTATRLSTFAIAVWYSFKSLLDSLRSAAPCAAQTYCCT